MKSVIIAGAAIAFVLSLPSLGRADLVYDSVNNSVSGEAFVPTYVDDNQSQFTTNTGPFSAMVSGASGPLGAAATYLSSINCNLSPDGSVIQTAGSTSWTLSNAPSGTTVNASSSTIVHFTVTTPQNFILTGSMTNAEAILNGPDSMSATVFSLINPPIGGGLLYGTLSTGDYYLTIMSAQSEVTTSTTSATFNGSFNLTLTTGVVPEPSSLCLAGLAFCGMAGYRWRRWKKGINAKTPSGQTDTAMQSEACH